jgi:hypothetical protein
MRTGVRLVQEARRRAAQNAEFSDREWARAEISRLTTLRAIFGRWTRRVVRLPPDPLRNGARTGMTCAHAREEYATMMSISYRTC